MKITKKALIIISFLMIVSFIGFSIFIGIQVFVGSTQLVTNEGTKGVNQVFLDAYNLDYKEFQERFKIEKIKIDSTFDQHIIPGDYIYSSKSNGSKDHQTVILVHGLGGNRYTNYPVAEYFLENGYNVISFDQRYY